MFWHARINVLNFVVNHNIELITNTEFLNLLMDHRQTIHRLILAGDKKNIARSAFLLFPERIVDQIPHEIHRGRSAAVNIIRFDTAEIRKDLRRLRFKFP